MSYLSPKRLLGLAVAGAGLLALAPTASAAPGDVVSAQPTTLRMNGLELLAPSRAWKLQYKSTDVNGNEITVTGLLAVPRKTAAGRPLIGAGHGSEGLGDNCAPSRHYTRGTEFEAPAMAGLLNRGWSVVVADGQGLGTPGDPTYMVGQSAGRTLLDAIRAARSVQSAGLPADGPTGLWGYSEGGATSIWANELQPTYAPDIKLAGAVAGGSPANLLDAADNLNGSLFATFLFQASVGLNAAYPELNLDSYLNNNGRTQLAKLRNACVIDALLLGAFKTTDLFTTTNPLTQPDWQAKIAENQPGQHAPDSPLYLYHGKGDEILPFKSVAALQQRYCQLGANAALRPYNQTHFPTYAAGANAAMTWLNQRLRGIPATPGCSPLPGN